MEYAKPDGSYTNYRIPGLVLTGRKSLLACCECRCDASDWATIDLSVRRSTDRGASWEETLLIRGNGGTVNNPMLTVNGDTVLFMYCVGYRQLFVCKSTDDGKTFSEPRQIRGVFEEGGFFYNAVAIGPGHGIVKDGMLLIPVWFAHSHENPQDHRPSTIATIYSADGGDTWHLGETIGKDMLNNPSECALAVWQGKVLMSIRHENEKRCRAFVVSNSGYSGWSEPAFFGNMPDPVCMGSMDHTADALYHVNCASTHARDHVTVKISRDCFATYTALMVDADNGGYADLAVDDQIFVLYERNYGQDGLYFTVLEKPDYA